MERIVRLRIERQPEGVWLATSEEMPDLVAQGRTVTETLEIARDVARKLLEAQSEQRSPPEIDDAESFSLRDASVGGRGLQPAFRGAGWGRIRDSAYEGRGS